MGKIPYARCEDCPLLERPFVPGSGPACPRGIIVGEAPGYTEVEQGKPFVGKAGHLLDACLDEAGLDRDELYITNVVHCHPKGNRFSAKAAECCRPAVAYEVLHSVVAGERLGGDTPVLTLGNKASKTFLHKDVSDIRPFWEDGFTAGWHPAGILRAPFRLHELRWDVQRFARAVHGMQRTQDVHVIVPDTLDSAGLLLEGIRTAADAGGITICIDLETVGLHWWEHKVLSIGIGVGHGTAYVIPEELVYSQCVLAQLIALFEHDDITVVGHNVTFDVKFLQQLGVYNARFDHDTMLAHYVLNENTPRDLKTLSTAYVDAPDYEGEFIDSNKRKKDGYDVIPRDILYKYNGYDVVYNLSLWHVLHRMLADEGMYQRPYLYPIMESVPYLAEMERHGMPVDTAKVHDVGVRLEEAAGKLYDTLEQGAGHEFNPNSWKQVQVIMYKEFKLPRRSGRGFDAGSTNKYARAEARKHLKPTDPRWQWLKDLDDLKSLLKLKSSYVSNLQIHKGHVYPSYRLDGAESGRMSARDPAIQTIPRASTGEVGGVVWGQYIRGMFTAPQGYAFVGVDYSQAELRTAAYLSNDPSLMEAYQAGRDIHDETASFLFGDDWTKENRQIAKNFNFASIYSFSENAFQVEEGFSVAEGRRLARQFHALRQGLVRWQKDQVKLMHRQGYVETLTGRRRRFPLIVGANSDEAAKAALNMPVQGTASDLTLMSFIEVCKWMETDGVLPEVARPAALIHDEILLLVQNGAVRMVGEVVKDIMVNTAEHWMPTLPWKVDIEVGPDWGHMKELQ